MSEPGLATVRLPCPGCKTENEVPLGAPRVVCLNCKQAIVFRKCSATGTTHAVLESWTTWTHPGCVVVHPVAVTPTATKTTQRPKSTKRKRWPLAIGIVVLGVIFAFGAVAVSHSTASATCDGSKMAPDDTCQVTGGSDPGTFSYDQMLAKSGHENRGSVVVLWVIAVGCLVLSGAIVYPSLRDGRKAKPSIPTGPPAV